MWVVVFQVWHKQLGKIRILQSLNKLKQEKNREANYHLMFFLGINLKESKMKPYPVFSKYNFGANAIILNL